MKEFICFPTTDVFVPVSQLSTRDLFDFLENLKIRQDLFVLNLSSSSIIRTTSIMILLFQIIFRNSFQESVVFLEYFTKSMGVNIGFLTYIFSERCFKIVDL